MNFIVCGKDSFLEVKGEGRKLKAFDKKKLNIFILIYNKLLALVFQLSALKSNFAP